MPTHVLYVPSFESMLFVFCVALACLEGLASDTFITVRVMVFEVRGNLKRIPILPATLNQLPTRPETYSPVDVYELKSKATVSLVLTLLHHTAFSSSLHLRVGIADL